MADALSLVARSFAYPGPDVVHAAREAAAALGHCGPSGDALGAAMADLATFVEGSARAAEERYTGLFDLSPVCTLHLGYHLYGESYERGSLLAGLSSEMEAQGLARGGELPDHLSLLLLLFARLDGESRALLWEHALGPGLERMRAALEGSASPWGAAIAALPPFLSSLISPEAREVALHA